MNFDNLKQMPIEELKDLAAKNGIKIHPRMKPENIANKIAQAATAPQMNPMQHPAEKPKEPAKMNTPDDIREKCKRFFEKEGFEATFTDETWHFKYKGAEDSGHLSTPLRIIHMKAESVSRGSRKPIILGKNELGQDVFAA